ncbi:MAG: hypothetical protein GEU97_23620 [Actinophytocola sp.]|nr:hypothetical protein [Actinophytocola sp.]
MRQCDAWWPDGAIRPTRGARSSCHVRCAAGRRGSAFRRSRTRSGCTSCAAPSRNKAGRSPSADREPGAGIEGIRQAHDEACRAAELRPMLADPPECVWYRDVRLEALLLDNVSAAHRFVTAELGALADDSERAHRIRETLLASLATGSQARAAAELGVHENTVRLRVRSAIEVLGEALTARRTELLVALRLRRALGLPQDAGAGAPAVDAAG